MAASPRLPALTANLMLDAGIGNVANTGRLRIYDGVQPAAGGGALSTQNKLLEFQLDTDAFPPATGGIATANPLAAAVGLVNGTATWFRLVKTDGTTVILDGSVGLAGSGSDCIIDDVVINVGDPVAVISLVVGQPLS